MALRRRYRVLIAIVLSGLATVAVALTVARVPFSSETLRRRLVATLSSRLDGDVELGRLTLRFYPELHVVGTDLRIHHRPRRDVPPLISVKQFTVRTGFIALWRKHVSHVNLEGLDIEIPPPNDDVGPRRPGADEPILGPIREVVVDELVADNARLTVLPRDPDGKPKIWLMHELHLGSVGAGRKMPFRSLLANGVPPGEITTTGAFGPWHADEPGYTPIEGRFTLEHADLSVFEGITGILAGKGDYHGTLDTLYVNGETSTPDFTISNGGHPVALTTKYRAVVDATDGDTQLQEVDGTFLNTALVAKGGEFDLKNGTGRLVTLNVTMDAGRLEDVMRLAVPTTIAPMTGGLRLQAKLDLPPGDEDVVERLRLDGTFTITNGGFTNADIQQKVNDLSRRASAKMSDESAATLTARSNFSGRFILAGGTLTLPRVTFNVPGAVVNLSGGYGLRPPEPIAFSGSLSMDANISQTTTGVRSLLLKMVDPLFRKDGRTVIPLRISGTRNAPAFGLDLRRVFKRDDVN